MAAPGLQALNFVPVLTFLSSILFLKAMVCDHNELFCYIDLKMSGDIFVFFFFSIEHHWYLSTKRSGCCQIHYHALDSPIAKKYGVPHVNSQCWKTLTWQCRLSIFTLTKINTVFKLQWSKLFCQLSTSLNTLEGPLKQVIWRPVKQTVCSYPLSPAQVIFIFRFKIPGMETFLLLIYIIKS